VSDKIPRFTDVTLDDLWVVWTYPEGASELGGQYEGTRSRPATRADILAVVKQMGGVEVEVPVLLGDVPDGRYLVIPIDSL
jgi:hypothetical protein